MRRDVTAALRLTLQGHLSLRKSRLESFCVLVVGVLLSRTVNLSHLACMFPTRAAIASNYRRLQRFFEQVILDGSQLARVIVRIAGVGSGPWLLALDRTCWKFGRYDINILMLAIIHKGIAIPVMWDVLGRAGNSTTAQRSALLSRFCAVFGEAAIAGLIADREFIGTAWMTSLAERDIPFILRIKDTFNVRLWTDVVPTKILVSEGWCGRTTLHPRGLPAWITRQLAWTAAQTGCDAVDHDRARLNLAGVAHHLAGAGGDGGADHREGDCGEGEEGGALRHDGWSCVGNRSRNGRSARRMCVPAHRMHRLRTALVRSAAHAR